MAVSKTLFQLSTADKNPVVEITGMDDTDIEVQDGGASGTTIHFIVANNVNNSAVTYLKLWDSAASPTEDATEPDMILPIPPSRKLIVTMLTGMANIWTSANKIYGIATATKPSGNTTNAEAQAAPASTFDCDFGLRIT